MFYVNIIAHIVPQISLLSGKILHKYSNYWTQACDALNYTIDIIWI